MDQKFINRDDAAFKLLPLLSKYRNEQGVVLAVPRGGVPIGYHIARSFGMPLELLMTKKIPHPQHEEFAVGAVSLEDHIVDERLGLPKSYIESEIERIRKSLKERYAYFMGNHKPVDLQNKVVILIDDGIATGNTILSSIKMLRKKKPKKIVVAVPVAPAEALQKLKKEVDDLICVLTPHPFVGVGLHYVDFSQVDDEEVMKLLRDANHIDNAA